jgi:hypothetical protein
MCKERNPGGGKTLNVAFDLVGMSKLSLLLSFSRTTYWDTFRRIKNDSDGPNETNHIILKF